MMLMLMVGLTWHNLAHLTKDADLQRQSNPTRPTWHTRCWSTTSVQAEEAHLTHMMLILNVWRALKTGEYSCVTCPSSDPLSSTTTGTCEWIWWISFRSRFYEARPQEPTSGSDGLVSGVDFMKRDHRNLLNGKVIFPVGLLWKIILLKIFMEI
jgi:hypothetical protein